MSRHIASLGTGYTLVIVGNATAPYDRELTRYLLGSDAPVVNIADPSMSAPIPSPREMGLTFIFFPGNQLYQTTIHTRFPGGSDGVFAGDSGKIAFFTYTVRPF